jgi:O-antigen/teichoic acid export membrane protein
MLRRFLKEQTLLTAIIGVSLAAYVGLLLGAKGFLAKILFSKGYEDAFEFIVFWGAISIVSWANFNASIGLQVMKEFSIITKVNCVTMVITLASSYLLIRQYGIKGGLASSLLGETLLALGLWAALIICYFAQATTAVTASGWPGLRSPMLAKRRMPS